MNQPPRLRFSRRRLSIARSSEFARLKEEGRREISGTLILNWLPAERLRLGVVTGRKIGSAVIRSRARRLLREVFRQHQHEVLAPVSMVLVARQSIASGGLEAVRKDYLRALSRARLRASDRNPDRMATPGPPGGSTVPGPRSAGMPAAAAPAPTGSPANPSPRTPSAAP